MNELHRRERARARVGAVACAGVLLAGFVQVAACDNELGGTGSADATADRAPDTSRADTGGPGPDATDATTTVDASDAATTTDSGADARSDSAAETGTSDAAAEASADTGGPGPDATDATTTVDASDAATTTDSGADARSDSAAETGTSDAAAEASADTGADARADGGDAGPSWCVRNPTDRDTAYALIALPYVAELDLRCKLRGFNRSGLQLQTVEECFTFLLRDRLGCAGAPAYAGSTSPASGEACGAGYFVYNADANNFSNADLDEALLALDKALDDNGYSLSDRTEIVNVMGGLRSTVVTTQASGLTHSLCADGGSADAAGGG